MCCILREKQQTEEAIVNVSIVENRAIELTI